MSRIKFCHTYDDIISVENILKAWEEFIIGKRNRKDVQIFQKDFMKNIFSLYESLKTGRYIHGEYEAFNISDPKPRSIHKASVRDRLVHHLIYQSLYPFFDRTFITDSYSCRIDKGTHKAINRFRKFNYKVSKNNTRTCWVLKCDIRKFFASIDHEVLLIILKKYIEDKDILLLLRKIIRSFYSTKPGKGLPLGNLTSQLLVNIYMNEFDQHVKHKLKAKYYIRYADDFVFLSSSKEWLLSLLPKINRFLKENLFLNLHPDKLFIKTFASGVDFLGWVHFSKHRVLRTVTKRRVITALNNNNKIPTLQSYSGLLSHGNEKELRSRLSHKIYFLLKEVKS
ncbi:MAG: reverse transcriptase/maturase family protein [Candidatus Paceibacterota bacterium]